MLALSRSIKADFCKFRHTPILWIHLLMPVLGAIAFLAYYSISPWNPSEKIRVYLESLTIVFPLLIGLICSMVISQEEQAGSFQEILKGTKWRGTAFLSKFILLIFGGGISIVIALVVFGVGFQYALDQGKFSINFYINEAVVLLLGNVFLYVLHLCLSLRYGKGASIGLGIVGSVISALMITGLGDGIWNIVPWAWGCRFCDYVIFKKINPAIYDTVKWEFHRGIINIIIVNVVAIMISLFWFERWEGRRVYE